MIFPFSFSSFLSFPFLFLLFSLFSFFFLSFPFPFPFLFSFLSFQYYPLPSLRTRRSTEKSPSRPAHEQNGRGPCVLVFVGCSLHGRCYPLGAPTPWGAPTPSCSFAGCSYPLVAPIPSGAPTPCVSCSCSLNCSLPSTGNAQIHLERLTYGHGSQSTWP